MSRFPYVNAAGRRLEGWTRGIRGGLAFIGPGLAHDGEVKSPRLREEEAGSSALPRRGTQSGIPARDPVGISPECFAGTRVAPGSFGVEAQAGTCAGDAWQESPLTLRMSANKRQAVFGTCGLAVVFGLLLLSGTGSAAAQGKAPVQFRTAQGCLYWLYDPDYRVSRPAGWSGNCTPGKPINGQGTLKFQIGTPTSPYFTSMSGKLVDGYLDGPVDYAAMTGDDVNTTRCFHYRMGRGVGGSHGPCARTPGNGAASASTAPAAPKAPATPSPSPSPRAGAAQPSPAIDPMYAKLNALREQAGRGDRTAQYELGYLYRMGRGGVGWNNAEAARWYRLAADQGEFRAQSALARMYELGHGVHQDDAEAIRWYRTALRNRPDAQGVADRLRALEARVTGTTPTASTNPTPERNLNDESRCIVPDFSGKGAAGFVNECSYPVYVSFCNLDAPEKSFSSAFDCRTQKFGLEGVPAKGRIAALIMQGRVFWMACQNPATPSRPAFELGRGIVARCKV